VGRTSALALTAVSGSLGSQAKEQFKKEEQPSKPKEARSMDKHKEVNSQRVRRKYQGPTAVAKKGGLKGWGTEAEEIQDELGRQGSLCFRHRVLQLT
jgi:hypothetical protein